jgi:hypothetical protein
VFAVEVTFDRDPYGHRSEYRRFEEPEIAAQFFESEAEPGSLPKIDPAEPARNSYPLSQIVEDLTLGERLESFNDETGKRVVAFELVEAVA